MTKDMNTTNEPEKSKLIHEEIALLAYQLWQKDGQQTGRDLEYWLRAEKELYAMSRPSLQSVPKPIVAGSGQNLLAQTGLGPEPRRGGNGRRRNELALRLKIARRGAFGKGSKSVQ